MTKMGTYQLCFILLCLSSAVLAVVQSNITSDKQARNGKSNSIFNSTSKFLYSNDLKIRHLNSGNICKPDLLVSVYQKVSRHRGPVFE